MTCKGKMRGKVKHFARCRLHGQHCEHGREIREKATGRAAEKRGWRRAL